MSTVILRMDSEKVHQTLESIDKKLEDKLQEIVNQTLEKVEQDSSLTDSKLLYYEANEIGLGAYNNLKAWSEKTFTTSPEKELAGAWINGCLYRFQGPRSIQKQIRQILQGDSTFKSE